MGWRQWAQAAGGLASHTLCSKGAVFLMPTGLIELVCELSFDERAVRPEKKKKKEKICKSLN